MLGLRGRNKRRATATPAAAQERSGRSPAEPELVVHTHVVCAACGVVPIRGAACFPSKLQLAPDACPNRDPPPRQRHASLNGPGALPCTGPRYRSLRFGMRSVNICQLCHASGIWATQMAPFKMYERPCKVRRGASA